MIKQSLIFTFLFFQLLNSFSKNVDPVIVKDNSLWLGYFSHIKLKRNWAINSDIQFRTRNELKESSQVLIRSGLTYSINNKIEFTLGAAHFRFFINNNKTRGEWRPWQEIKIADQFGKIKFSNRFRLEQRFNELVRDDVPTQNYQFNWRFRHRIDLRVPLKKEKDNGNNLYALIGNELMINAGKNIRVNYFDQNRLYIGLNYEINKQMSVQLQYMHLWQLSSYAREMNFTNILRFNFYHTISI
jgi:hypothetical protein